MLATKTVFRRCPVCASDSVQVFHHQSFAAPRELNAAPEYDVVGCERCGLAYADHDVSQQTIDLAYEAHSKYATEMVTDAGRLEASPPTDPPWDLARLRDVAAYLADKIIDKNARVLDAGCSNGSFLAFMREQGFTNLLGLEPSHTAVATAVQFNRVDAIAGSFITPPPDIGRFDLVALSHVLEHLNDVSDAVTSLRALLKPGGLAYIEVPDAARYTDYLVAPFHDFNTEHINHFSLPVLRTLLAQYGFEEVESGAKTVLCSLVDDYPAIFGLWRKTDDKAPTLVPTLDAALARQIAKYVNESKKLFAEMNARLEQDLEGHEEVIVWGAGQLTMKLLLHSVLARKRIVTVIDSSPSRRGMHIGEIEILPPAAIKTDGIPIVIGSLHHEESILSMAHAAFPKNPIVRLYRR